MTENEIYIKSKKELKQYNLTIAKQNVAIRKARYSLSTQQQKILCYLISQLKITDTAQTEKLFDIKEFFDFMAINCKSYERIRDNLKLLRDKSWWVEESDGSETAVSFLSRVNTNKRNGKATIKFNEDMLPYLQELNAQNPYTRYKLFYIMTMKSQYSMRLYELLKSVEKLDNWTFSIDKLKKQFDCDNYKKFNDFKKRVIEVAISEINKKSDITVTYEFIKTGRAYTDIEFNIETKADAERLVVEKQIREELDGQLTFGGDTDGK